MDYFVTEISKDANGNYATLVSVKSGVDSENEANMLFHQIMSSFWANYKSRTITRGICTVVDGNGFGVLSGTVPAEAVDE